MSPEKDYEEKGQLGALNRQDALDDYVRIRLGMPQSDHLSIRGRFRRGIMGQSKKKLKAHQSVNGFGVVAEHCRRCIFLDMDGSRDVRRHAVAGCGKLCGA